MDKQIAAELWDSMVVTVDSFHQHLDLRPKVDLLGFADITLSIPSVRGFVMKLRGIVVKVLNGRPRIETPAQRGDDGKYTPVYFPKTGELRAVMTARIFEAQGVHSAIAAGEQQRAAAVPVGGYPEADAHLSENNPYRDTPSGGHPPDNYGVPHALAHVEKRDGGSATEIAAALLKADFSPAQVETAMGLAEGTLADLVNLS